MEVRERIAYIRGLLEGSEGPQDGQREHSVWKGILDVCDSLAESVLELRKEQDDLEEYVYGIDADLLDLEEEIYGSSEDAKSDGQGERVELAEDEEAEDGEEELVRAECPRCGEELFFEESFLYDDGVEISCPDCGEVLYRSDGALADENGWHPQDGPYSLPSEGERPSP